MLAEAAPTGNRSPRGSRAPPGFALTLTVEPAMRLSMTTKPFDRWRSGSTAASLLVAYLLVVQGFVTAFAGVPLGGGSGAFAAGALCASSTATQAAGGKSLPAQTNRHSEQCCIFHCAGAGAPPVEAEAAAVARSWRLQAVRWADGEASRAPRSLLPVGSRAPPKTVV